MKISLLVQSKSHFNCQSRVQVLISILTSLLLVLLMSGKEAFPSTVFCRIIERTKYTVGKGTEQCNTDKIPKY